jgi:tetrahydromethanopterin S-methyltransferase subunit B
MQETLEERVKELERLVADLMARFSPTRPLNAGWEKREE